MTTQYTPTLKLALPVTGELSGTWGDVVNDNITSMIEQAIAGLSTINTWTGNAHTLTTANGTTSESRCAMLVAATGGGAPTAAAEIICPAAAKLYVLQNNTSYAVTLKTSAGTGVAVAVGNTAFLFCDGTNVNSCVTTIVDGNITGNLTVGGNATINGNTTLGNATTDTITATARFNTDLLPSTDNARDLGSVANSWKDLYIDGTAYLALVDINGGTIDGVSIGATTAATLINVDNLRLDGNTISSTDTNGNIVIAPNGTGDVQLDSDTVRVGDSGAAATLTSNGAGALTVTTGGAADLTLSTNSGTTSGTVVIANGANGNITLTPDGTGDVILSADRVQMGDSNTDTTLTTNGTGSLNLTTNNGTNSGTIQIAQGVNGNITLTPNGTGSVSVPKLVWSNGTTTRVPYLTTGGQFTDSANLTFSGTSLSTTQIDITAQGQLRLQDTTGGEYVALRSPGTLSASYTLTFPADDGTSGQALITDGSGVLSWSSAASGDVYGPASATDNALARFDSTTGKIIQNSVGILSDAGVLTGLTGLTSSGSITFSGLTSGRVPYATTAGLLTDSANLTYAGTDLIVYGIRIGRGTNGIANNVVVGPNGLNAITTGDSNVAIGENSLAQATTGGNNVSIGIAAMPANTTGSQNVGIGSGVTAVTNGALGTNTTGNYNVAVGVGSSVANSTGSNNTTVGWYAGYNNLTNNNTAIGSQALYSNTSAGGQVAVGTQAGFSNTTGTENTFLGYRAGYTGTTTTQVVYVGAVSGESATGSYNTGVGSYTLRFSTGGSNFAGGYAALASNTSGGSNVAVGSGALQLNTTASNNTAVGYQSLYTNTTGTWNTALGYQAGYTSNNTGVTAIGYQALKVSVADYNTAVGLNAGVATTSGTVDAFGAGALGANTTGAANSAFSRDALTANTTGSYNTAIGRQALQANTTASNNTAVGYQALYANTTGAGNTAVGFLAGDSVTTATGFTALGYQAGASIVTNNYCTMIGYSAGLATTGEGNCFVGSGAGQNVSSGNYNTFVGNNGALGAASNVTGSNNVLVGYNAGFYTAGAANGNTYVGPYAGDSMTTGSKNTILGRYSGNQGSLDIRTASNYIVLSDGDGTPRQVYNNTGGTGLGAAPLNAASIRGYELGTGGAAYHGNGSRSYLTANAFWNDVQWTRVNASPAVQAVLDHNSGTFIVGSAVTGSAGSAVSFINVVEVIANGTLALQGANPATGTGITFPATQSASSNANTLDDYEEGSWTPIYTGGGVTPTYSEQTGRYIKIGQMVYISLRLVITASSGGSGALRVGGLPFTTNGSGSNPGFIALNFSYGWNSSEAILGFIPSSGSTALDAYTQYAAYNANTQTTVAAINAGGTIYIIAGGCYQAAN
jgi:hypothetical protein